jgi:hypothetical protein
MSAIIALCHFVSLVPFCLTVSSWPTVCHSVSLLPVSENRALGAISALIYGRAAWMSARLRALSLTFAGFYGVLSTQRATPGPGAPTGPRRRVFIVKVRGSAWGVRGRLSPA